jgi:single-stranded DNA-binding protein
MSIPTQASLAGFIASDPQLSFTSTGEARFYARVGVEHARREPDGSYTALEPSFHDLVIFRKTAERAYAQFTKGDTFVASGYIHVYATTRDGEPVSRQEFVARRIGHDTARTRYTVDRTPTASRAQAAEAPSPKHTSAQATGPAVGL